MYAIAAAVERPDLVSLEIIEINENIETARKYGAMSVPRTFINETLTADGLEAEEMFMESLLLGKKAYRASHDDGEEPIESTFDVIILGAGPAGLTAAIYARRSGLKAVVLETATIGGQISLTPAVENYPGFPNIAGNTLVELMAKQTLEYVDVHEGAMVDSISDDKGVFTVETTLGAFKSRALILATGASHRKLGAKGEERLGGRGVSYCSTCDGYQFKDGKAVVVVGGGSSALTDALYMESLGAKVTVVHRRDTFRAEMRLQESLKERGIKVIFDSELSEIRGTAIVEGVTLRNVKTGKTSKLSCEGVFIAVGYDPNTEVAKLLGAKLDKAGYIKVDNRQRTSLKGVYAAGDVTGGIKQITVAVGQGSIAAITAFEDITNKSLHAPL
ncbi:MAG: FAD-dependent oxidoreductase [Thermodesulfovibrionales bacterium]|nr:FAD-dependent oxidoreductase [Thermodesulfovibrionales bacterium]